MPVRRDFEMKLFKLILVILMPLLFCINGLACSASIVSSSALGGSLIYGISNEPVATVHVACERAFRIKLKSVNSGALKGVHRGQLLPYTVRFGKKGPFSLTSGGVMAGTYGAAKGKGGVSSVLTVSARGKSNLVADRYTDSIIIMVVGAPWNKR